MKFFLHRSFRYLAVAFLTSFVVPFSVAQNLRQVQLAHHHGWNPISALHMATKKGLQRAFLSVQGGLTEEEESQDMCRGHKYEWKLEISRRCQKAFGDESRWDVARGHGSYCRLGYRKCLTMYYVECCSRKEGPKKLNDYCKIRDSQGMPTDPACRFQPNITKIDNEVKVMVKTADEVVNPKPKPSTTLTTSRVFVVVGSSPAGAAPTGSVPTGAVPAGAASAGAASAGPKDQTSVTAVSGGPEEQTSVTHVSGGPDEQTSLTPVSASPEVDQTSVTAVPGTPEEQTSVTAVSAGPGEQTPVLAFSPAAAPAAASAPAAAPVLPPCRPQQGKTQESDEEKQKADEVDEKILACKRFAEASQRVQLLIGEVKKQKDLEEADHDLDPDLKSQVDKVLAVGSFLQGQQQICQVKVTPSDDDDDDEDDSDFDSDEDEEEDSEHGTETAGTRLVNEKSGGKEAGSESDETANGDGATKTVHDKSGGKEAGSESDETANGDGATKTEHDKSGGKEAGSDSDEMGNGDDATKAGHEKIGGEEAGNDSDDMGNGDNAGQRDVTDTGMKTGYEESAEKEAGNEMGQIDDAGQKDVLVIQDPARQEVVVVHTAVFSNLSVWVSSMSAAIHDVETKVHPHGRKWWRYRYEYSMVETLFMVFSIVILLILNYFLHLIDRQSRRENDLKLLQFLGRGLYRVNFQSFLQGSGSLVCLQLVYWVLSYTSIFDWLAGAIQPHVGLRTPFLGLSYYLTLTDVVMHLFGGFVVYELFIIQVVREVRHELATWSELAKPTPTVATRGFEGQNLKLVETKLESRRIEQKFNEMIDNMEVYGNALRQKNLDQFARGFVNEEGTRKVKLHLYLTVYMGQCVLDLCGMAVPTWIFISLIFAIGAITCWVTATGFIMFLFPLNMALVVVLVLMYSVSRRIVNDMLGTKKLDPRLMHSKYLTPSNFCQAMQIILFLVSYSFTRIILSYEMVTERFWIWMLVTVSFAVVYYLFAWVGAEVVNHTLTCLAFPPYIHPARLTDHMKDLYDWHMEKTRPGLATPAF